MPHRTDNTKVSRRIQTPTQAYKSGLKAKDVPSSMHTYRFYVELKLATQKTFLFSLEIEHIIASNIRPQVEMVKRQESP